MEFRKETNILDTIKKDLELEEKQLLKDSSLSNNQRMEMLS